MRLPSGKEFRFPNLDPTVYEVTSPETPEYNCMVWAAGDSTRWWWPLSGAHWPSGAPRMETVDSFRIAFETMGYEVCPGQEYEQGFEKVAIYAHTDGVPTHVARQLENGRWTSKLGDWEDIEHDKPKDLENGATCLQSTVTSYW